MSSLSSISNSLLASLNAPRVTITGLASGLDTDKIIEGLLTIQQQRIDTLKANQDKIVSQQTAFKGIEARLLTLQGQISQLSKAQNGVLDARKAVSSLPDLLTATVSSSALPGVHSLQVTSLAKSHQIASQGYNDPNSTITQGAFQLRMGSGATTTITIDGTNNTLQGLANAINASGSGVTATIINDGSAAHTQPYRLVLSGSKTGVSNAITVTNNLGADSGSAFKPVFDATYIGAANVDANFTGTSVPTSNAGAGVYTGTSNNTYKFTVTTGGTVGTNNNLFVAWVDNTGASGTIEIDNPDVNKFLPVAQGVQVKFSAGTLVAGQTFSIDGFVPTVQAATDASVTLGSGGGAITVQSATNQIDGLIPGGTLDLKAADATKTVTVTVSDDTEKARKAIVDFVDTYNELMKYIDEQTRFDSTTGVAGPLLGSRLTSTIQDQVRKVVTSSVDGVNTSMNRLSAIGITTNDKGKLVLNTTKLDDALAGKITGVTVADVRKLFVLAGTSTNAGVQFVTGSAKTKASISPYQVDVTQAALQGAITAASDLAASTVIDGTNNAFSITVDGLASGMLTLASGTYTRAGFAQQVQSVINAATTLAGRKVAANLSGNKLAITSATYGAVSKVTIGTGSALTPMGFVGTETGQGQDVAGNFIFGGSVEPATGSGQFLIGNATNTNSADLQVRVTLTPAQVGAGTEADLTVSRGIASKVEVTLASLLDPVSGRVKTINDGFSDQIEDANKTIAQQTLFMENRRQSLLKQFAALEKTLSELQAAGNFLTTQFAALLPRK